MTSDRSNRADVRNPVITLPSASLLADLPPESKAAMEAILRDLSRDARERADKAWRKHKGPMAVYWKAVAVYSRHLALAMRREGRADA
jgi:hypothetical protein